MRIHLDKIASITRNMNLGRWVTLSPEVDAQEGAVIAGVIHGEKSVYNQLEDVHGRMSVLHAGDIVVGALGHRNALQGYEGVLPTKVEAGDRLHLLNLGGVIGHCVSSNVGVGAPFEIEVLGQVLVFPQFGARLGQPAFIQASALAGKPGASPVPVVYVAGTCMNAGKTLAACALVRAFSKAGYKVGGAKLTGVSLMRDILAMQDYGADAILDFTDAGVSCTGPATAPQAARIIFSELAARGVDLIVAETGDGILGEYGVQAVLSDPELREWGAAYVLCANDPVGVAGGVRHMKDAFGLQVDVVAGPATDNQVGVRFVETLGLPAINAQNHPRELGELVLAKVRNTMGVPLNQVAILGASGYGGGELLRWLSTHPAVSRLRGTSRARAGKPFWDAHPNLRGVVDGRFEDELPWEEFAGDDQPVVFSALPHGQLAERLPALEAAWAKAGIQDRLLLVDLSGDFRLKDPQVFAEAYGKAHPCPEHLSRFVYGLPEWNRAALAGARRIASPGCFATALQMALLPLRGLDIGWMAASAATGSSGSGATPGLGTHHPLRFGDFRAYKVLNHQHLAEVRAGMAACGIRGELAFVPQSAPMVRGIFASLSFPLPAGMTQANLRARAQEAYQDSPLVRLVEDSPRVGAVAGSAFCDLSVTARDGSGVVLAAIDNLGKGMASQAVQNMNLALGLPETLGLMLAGRYPG